MPARRQTGGEEASLDALPARIGLRESRHIHARHRLTTEEVLHGIRFPDAIANGSYRVDIHHQDKPGITLRYLDGREEYSCPGKPKAFSRWREETTDSPTFYQVPYRALLPREGPDNLIAAGRMVDAEPGAHGGIRVMVNMNQTGEAAGVAAVLSLRHETTFADVPPALLRGTLADGGPIIL